MRTVRKADVVVEDALSPDSNHFLKLLVLCIAGNGDHGCIPGSYQPLPQSIKVPQNSSAQEHVGCLQGQQACIIIFYCIRLLYIYYILYYIILL